MRQLYLKAGCRNIQDVLNMSNELLQSCLADKKSKFHLLWYLTQTVHPPPRPEVQEKTSPDALSLCLTVVRARGGSKQCLGRAVAGHR